MSFEQICKRGNIEEVKSIISNEILKLGGLGIGLYGACEGGHLDIINLLIEKGVTDWNSGLYGACLGGVTLK